MLAATEGQTRIVVGNKADLPASWDDRDQDVDLAVSATRGTGIGDLATRIAARLASLASGDDVLVTNERQRALLRAALDHLAHAVAAIDGQAGEVPEEFLVADLVRAQAAIEELTGARAPDDVLAEIFDRFCIGK